MTTRALVVFSGGQDSTICLGWALTRYEEVACLTFDYGQRHRAEIDAAAAVREHFERHYGHEIPHEVVRLGPDVLRGTSPLTDPTAELETYPDHAAMEAAIGDRVERTFVPMRNTLFLTIAANRAVAMGSGTALVTGVCQEDNANYPDCRDKFIQTLARAFSESLDANLGTFVIETPLMYLSKADSVRLSLDTAYTYAALAWSHTAYDGEYPPRGRDHASVLRAHGFEVAGKPDPLVLRAVHEGLMDMPATANYNQGCAFIEALRDDWERAAYPAGATE